MVAILYGEPERERFRRVLELTPGLVEDVRPVLAGLGTSVAAVDEAQAALAQEGQVRFGLGRGKPPAVLNFGDLFAYAASALAALGLGAALAAGTRR